jgi:hypothetical protein
MILDETRERFLMAIAKQVDPARIAEVHFFAPIRQGGVESGVAVIAAARVMEAASEEVENPIAQSEDSSESSRMQDADSTALTQEENATSPARDGMMASAEAAPAVVESEVARDEGVEGAVAAGEHVESAAAAGGDPSEASPPQYDDVGAPPQNDDSAASSLNDDSAADDAPALSDPAPAPTPIERHVIYTARYRLTLKGPDRGKWETQVTAEADAPIITVDAVVRGVQRRAGDVDDPTRMTGDEVRASLPAV